MEKSERMREVSVGEREEEWRGEAMNGSRNTCEWKETYKGSFVIVKVE